LANQPRGEAATLIDAELAQKSANLTRALLEDAERLIAAWNDRQAKHMPMLF
jgi:hypothetical protein